MHKPCSPMDLLLHLVLNFLLLHLHSSEATTANTTIGLSFDLIHIDSVRSPFYVANMTDEQRTQRLVEISNSRLRWMDYSLGESTTGVSPLRMTMRMTGAASLPLHFVSVSIGTPPTVHLLQFDIGSNLMWVKCVPPPPRPQPSPAERGRLFDQHRSSTYRRVMANDPICDNNPLFSRDRGVCRYRITYPTTLFSEGILSKEHLTGRSADNDIVSVPELVFGCSHESGGHGGHPMPPRVAGVLGMSWGAFSLPKQLGESFSYCLSANPDAVTRLRMGSDVLRVRRRHQMWSTPLVLLRLYYVNLLDITIGNRRVHIPRTSFGRIGSSQGNCALDTGAPYSLLPTDAFNRVGSVVLAHFEQRYNLQPITDGETLRELKLVVCFPRAIEPRELPEVVFHFNRANLVVRGVHAFKVVQPRGATCLAILPSDSRTVIGSYQQRDIRFVFDIEESKLDFGPEDCSQDGEL